MSALLPGQMLLQSAEAWAIRITERYRSSVESIIETGRLINQAKKALPHGEFGHMIANSLPFGERMAQMLMAIASDGRLSNPKFISLLPPSCGTLYDLTRLSDDELETAVIENKINPEMPRREVALLRPRSEGHMHDTYAPHHSDAPGSPVGDSPRPHGESLQQGLDTSSIPGTADHSPQGEGTGAASVANPEETSGYRDPHVPPGASEANPDAGEPPGDTGSQNRAEADPDREAGLPGGSPASAMPGGGLAIAHNRIEPSDSLDFFPTPPWATRALIECVFRHMGREGHCQFQRAWEPACGMGHMSEPLKEYFREVLATDVHDYLGGSESTNFLEQNWTGFDWIITNPPFNDSAEFVLKAIKLAGTGVAMFVRLSWLESVGRYEKIFRDHPPTVIAIFSERVPLHKGRWEEDGATMTAYIWLVWIKGAEPRASFWIPPGQREALTRPDDARRFGRAPAPAEQPSPGNDSTEDAAA